MFCYPIAGFTYTIEKKSMKYGLSEEHLNQIIDFLSKFSEIEEALIFGSRALGTFKIASDIDLVLKGEKSSPFLAVRIKSELEDETNIPLFFDVVDFNTIDNSALKEHIQKYGKVRSEEHTSELQSQR